MQAIIEMLARGERSSIEGKQKLRGESRQLDDVLHGVKEQGLAASQSIELLSDTEGYGQLSLTERVSKRSAAVGDPVAHRRLVE